MSKKANLFIEFGVPYFDVFDPRFPDFSVPVAVRGSVSLCVKNMRKLQKRLGAALERRVREIAVSEVKKSVLDSTRRSELPVYQIESMTEQISDRAQPAVAKRLKAELGVILVGIGISHVELDSTSSGYKRLAEITKDVTADTVKARAELEIKTMRERQHYESADYGERLAIKREKTRTRGRRALLWGVVIALIAAAAIVAVKLL